METEKRRRHKAIGHGSRLGGTMSKHSAKRNHVYVRKSFKDEEKKLPIKRNQVRSFCYPFSYFVFCFAFFVYVENSFLLNYSFERFFDMCENMTKFFVISVMN